MLSNVKKITVLMLASSLLIACGGGSDGDGGSVGGTPTPAPTPSPTPSPTPTANRLKTFNMLSGLYQMQCGAASDDSLSFGTGGEVIFNIKKRTGGAYGASASSTTRGGYYSLFLQNGDLFKLLGSAPRMGGGGSITYSGTFKHDPNTAETNLASFYTLDDSNQVYTCQPSSNSSFTRASNLKPADFRAKLDTMIGSYQGSVLCKDAKGDYTLSYDVSYANRTVVLKNAKEQITIDLNKNLPYNEGYYFLENKSPDGSELDRFEYQASWSQSKTMELSLTFEQDYGIIEVKYPAKALECSI